ncbi:uncharacterized protein LOC126842504 [Adelges cooleyi]|uniref:uncharacterized protein LOC126842504 n=1 Tax=Adelges cooleyi TaxID=133065 RepID=UPI0021806036|nr:uncharacterized protein LOC126842504 [Adelges cooleyi]
MDQRGSLRLALMFCVYTVNVEATIHPVCKGQTPQKQYHSFLRHFHVGYDIADPETGATDLASTVKEIKTNTLCGVQTICLSIMRMTRPAHDENANTWKVKFEPFYGVLRDAMVILYNIDSVYDSAKIYPLWLVYLYVEDSKVFYWRKTTAERMGKIHEMITAQLAASTELCPRKNAFDVTDEECRFFEEYSGKQKYGAYELASFASQIKQYFDEIHPTLRAVTKENYKQINVRNLRVNTESFLRAKRNFYQTIKDGGINIEWDRASTKLRKAYDEAKEPTNLYDGCQGIKSFQKIYLTLMKLVMLRFIWIHLLLAHRDNKPNVNYTMYETANSFATTIGLNDDEAFDETVKHLQIESPSLEDSQTALKNIRTQLTAHCQFVNACEISTINEEDIPEIFSVYWSKVTTQTDIDKNRQLAVKYVKEVKHFLTDVDQEFVKSVLAVSYPIDKNF